MDKLRRFNGTACAFRHCTVQSVAQLVDQVSRAVEGYAQREVDKCSTALEGETTSTIDIDSSCSEFGGSVVDGMVIPKVFSFHDGA